MLYLIYDILEIPSLGIHKLESNIIIHEQDVFIVSNQRTTYTTGTLINMSDNYV